MGDGDHGAHTPHVPDHVEEAHNTREGIVIDPLQQMVDAAVLGQGHTTEDAIQIVAVSLNNIYFRNNIQIIAKNTLFNNNVCIQITATRKIISIRMYTKSYGYENSWVLGSCQSLSRRSHKNHRGYTRYCYFSTGHTYRLTCKCSYGDGWHGGYIKIQGRTYCKGFTSGKTRYEYVKIR